MTSNDKQQYWSQLIEQQAQSDLSITAFCKTNPTGFSITRYRTIKLMARLKLVVTQRLAYKVTTKRKHSDSVADNLLNMNFNPVGPNQVWAGDVSYLKLAKVGYILQS